MHYLIHPSFKSISILTGAGLVVSVCTVNRAFIIGYIVSLIFLFLLTTNFRISIKKYLLILAGLALTLSGLITLVKPDSALGRILIYKISFNVFKENLTGIGLGKFPVRYNLYQAEYFRAGHYTTKELLLADNVYYAFNDYWQFIIETGVAGILLLLFACYCIVLLIYRALKHNEANNWVKLACAQLIAISVAALFTHVFEKSIFQLAVLLILIYIFLLTNKVKWNIFKYAGVFLLIVLGFMVLKNASYLKSYKSYIKFEEAKELSKAGFVHESLSALESIYTELQNDAGFLIYYSDELTPDLSYKQALKVIKHTLTKRSSNILYKKLGDAYFKAGDLYRAERSYQLAVFMVPNRFRTKYTLFKYYLLTKRFDNARSIGKLILNMPVKIPSPEIQQIKYNVTEELLLNKN
ncbi:MAG TPA: O-antigen ligase family protein [Sphingobacteriaceae bacterium]|nr:O-antigen ligase family protein [Sphingobacteriaceae bacterium]